MIQSLNLGKQMTILNESTIDVSFSFQCSISKRRYHYWPPPSGVLTIHPEMHASRQGAGSVGALYKNSNLKFNLLNHSF